MAKTDCSVTSRIVAHHIEDVTHHSVSARTIRRHLQQSGLSARRLSLSLPLTQNHRRLRRQWCDERRMSVAEWNEVVFTDESRICLQHHNGRIRGALGSVANHPLEKAEVIADSLQKQFEPNTEAENDRFTAFTQRKIKRFLDAPTCLDLEKTTPGEVQEYIKKLKINKSPGLGLITNRILKNLPLKFVLFIFMLFNLLMENCHFPKKWKTAVVVPILKPNSDDTQLQNYRPISLLSSLSKAYEFVLLNHLNPHCIARNIIIPEQHGFVTQCSTVTQLLRVTELIHQGFQNN
ncbi:RNA-directed DNA polymerase from mobile element jockey [Trichonephila clavipes]|nr:RNA-directed DNA polymerase from mobile element jockey [Trichonephila clavipes]